MGGGVVESLVRAGIATAARDIRPKRRRAPSSHGAAPTDFARQLARACDVVIVLVVDAEQVDTVLFGGDGVTTARARDRVVLVSSTVDPAYVAALAPRLSVVGIALLDAPVSGGPAKAAAGTMTMMVSGDRRGPRACAHLLDRIAGRVFVLGPASRRRVDVQDRQQPARRREPRRRRRGARARAGGGPRLAARRDVVNASSGASWIFADRVARALAGDYARERRHACSTRTWAIAAALAARLGVDAPFTRVRRTRSPRRWPRGAPRTTMPCWCASL